MLRVLKTILVMSIAGTSAFAQYFPVAGEKQVLLGATNNGGFIMLRKFKTEIINNRYGAGFSYNVSANNSTDLNGFKTSSNNSYINASFTFGRQINFNMGERFSPYIALDAGVNLKETRSNNGTSIADTSLYNKNLSSGDLYISKDNSTLNSSLSPGIIILPAIGFNYYIAKNFALGAECRINALLASFNLTNSSSHSSSSYIDVDPATTDSNTGQTVYTRELITTSPPDTKSTGNGFNMSGSISPQLYVTASFYFK